MQLKYQDLTFSIIKGSVERIVNNVKERIIERLYMTIAILLYAFGDKFGLKDDSLQDDEIEIYTD